MHAPRGGSHVDALFVCTCAGGCEPNCGDKTVIKVGLDGKNGVPPRMYEFKVVKTVDTRGKYSDLMKAACKRVGKIRSTVLPAAAVVPSCWSFLSLGVSESKA